MNEKLKGYGSFLLALICAFIIGCYTAAVFFDIKPVNTHQWIMASLFMMYFLSLGIEKIRKT